MRQLLLVLSVGLVLGVRTAGIGGAAAAADDWPQWRGPHGTGVAEGTYPDRWSPTEHIAFKTEIPGKGHSSPSVWGNRIYITTQFLTC